MNVSTFTLSSKMVKRDRCEKNILLLVYPCSTTTSIVPARPLQEVGRLACTARQHAGCPYGINCLFHIIFCSLEYSYLYFVCIVLVSYSRLYCSFNKTISSSGNYFLTHIIIYDLFLFCLSLISMAK